MLFTDDECAKFLKERYQEPVFCYGPYKVIGWSDDPAVLKWFMGVSLVRALKLLATKNKKFRDPVKKMLISVNHALEFDKDYFLHGLMLMTLSAPFVHPWAKKIVCDILGIKEAHFQKIKPAIDGALKGRNGLQFLEGLADSDSSMPSYVHVKDPLKD
ncbi:hypothetical protein Ngar_c12490 [Candidatus Nitrososphaera gargensis Ga9.2]|uniref:Uncharacterized protein n=1 Tax=Nitrososphaera gargensis (strain Ga9.2) TaxID=1237085 RepID=K0IMT6_NITGG|nr:hypothetical protein [Candidatus Nitrososphaera gargensis]AFU58189.1 hypothetical protein Ngar_c12490 [Candidatus Nitrososphaera gargensis Ga9.2]